MRSLILSNFNITLVFYISINDIYDYTINYIDNVARSFTKKFPSYLINKKSEDKIKAFLAM